MKVLELKKLGPILERGLLPEFAPSVVKGLLIQFFRSAKVDVKELSHWIEEDVSLWGKIGQEHQPQVRNIIRKIGDVNWFTADWLIENLRKDLPSLCSLFLGWEEAYKWLERQVNEIKSQAKQGGAIWQ